MMSNGLSAFLFVVSAGCALSFPYRQYSSRSVPGRVKASSDPNIQEYLANYLLKQQQHMQNQQLHELPYSLPEYQPVYQQGYISKSPQISQSAMAAIMPYLPQSEIGDYSYDYNADPSNSYTDEDGTWYDDDMSQDFNSNVDKHNQDAALLQLFLDHLAGKYSLEDLETLERQAAIEDNTENELQNLMPRKKAINPLLGSLAASRKLIGYPRERQGQKEEALLVPVTSVRKPIFTRSPPKTQEPPKNVKPETSTRATLTKAVKPSKSEATKTAEMTSKHNFNQQSTPSMAKPTTTMEPAMKSAYEDFLHYLDQERYLRKAADDAKHTPQKRFISEPQDLTQQLVNLKKSIIT